MSLNTSDKHRAFTQCCRQYGRSDTDDALSLMIKDYGTGLMTEIRTVYNEAIARFTSERSMESSVGL